MEVKCRTCRSEMQAEWKFCPRCGVLATYGAPSVDHIEHITAKRTTVVGGFGGLLVGLVITPAFIIVGTLLCLTGLGALLGVPMIVAGVLAPLAGSVLGLWEHKGRCPECGTRVVSVADGHGHSCPSCSKEFDITPKALTHSAN